MTELSLDVESAENGYIVMENLRNAPGAYRRRWVANSPIALAELMRELANDHRDQQTRYQFPKEAR